MRTRITVDMHRRRSNCHTIRTRQVIHACTVPAAEFEAHPWRMNQVDERSVSIAAVGGPNIHCVIPEGASESSLEEKSHQRHNVLFLSRTFDRHRRPHNFDGRRGEFAWPLLFMLSLCPRRRRSSTK